MDSFRDLIARWPTVADFGREIGVGYQTARKMHERDSISDTHWVAVVDAAKTRGIRVTVEKMAALKARAAQSKKAHATPERRKVAA